MTTTLSHSADQEVLIDSIPVALRERDQWVVWRYEVRAGKRTKVPIHPKFGWNASASNPDTWTSFTTAWEAFLHSSRYEGVAYVFCAEDPFCGIDIDDCLNDEGNLLWGEDLLKMFDSYCEISPSGRGLKLILRGTKPPFARCKADWFGQGTIEVYDQKRVFSITGRRFGDMPGVIHDRQSELDDLCTQVWRDQKPSAPSAGGPADQLPTRLTVRPACPRWQGCLDSMLRMQISDHSDGSHRLYSACCRAVEHGLSDIDALACLREYEHHQPFPKEWSNQEMLRRLRDAERACQRGNANVVLVPTEPPTIGDLLLACPTLRPPVVHGLLREGETMNVIASPKAGKSWLAADLALMLATGRPLFGAFETEPGPVLLIDNELHQETIAFRLGKVADARGIGLAEFASRIQVESLRGRLVDVQAIAAWFVRLPARRFAAVIIDSLYRMLPPGTDENDNAAMCRVYNTIDSYAEQLGAAFILVHHTSKGNQSGKSVTDVGSGAGSISRATDSHLILRPHTEPNCAVLEAAVRSWPPVDPRVLRWTFPVWTPDASLDPGQLRNDAPGGRAKGSGAAGPVPAKWTPQSFVETFLTATAQSWDDILDAAEEAGVSERQVRKLLRAAIRQELIFQRRVAANRPAEYATAPFPTTSSRQDLIAELLRSEPGLSNRQAAERLQVSHTLVQRVRRQLAPAGNCHAAPLETA